MAFLPSQQVKTVKSFGVSRRSAPRPLYATAEEQSKNDDEMERLKSMAAKLRAEVAALEADRAKELSDAAEKAFRKFDTDMDGSISFEELKTGLEKELKMELPEKRVKELLDNFDVNKDGQLGIEEFVGVNQFRNRLEQLAREEKKAAQEAQKAAQTEAATAKIVDAQLELINDKEPNGTDKILSVLPYLFPLLDSLQFGRFILIENESNPLVGIIAILFALYKAVPLGGFIAFFALSALSSNLSINRLIRFNMQQAIFLDIALFFPGLFASLYALLFSSMVQLPASATEIGSDLVFFGIVATVTYSSISSLLGITPDKIPIVSQAAADRMPNIDADMFDSKGNFVPPRSKKDDEKKDEEKKND